MKKQYIEQSVKYYWKDIVGDDVARHVSCGKFSRGTLTVHADSSVWSHQVLMMKRTLIKKINEFAGDKIVKDIRIQTGYQAKFREINKDLPNLDHYLNQITLEEETIQDIKKKTASVTDDKLRYKLTSILEKQKKLDKLKVAHGYHPCSICGTLCEKKEMYCIGCRRQKRQEKQTKIKTTLLGAPFLTYAKLSSIVPCTNTEYQEIKADLIDQTAKKLREGDTSDMTRYLIAMLVTGMTPDIITEDTVNKVVLKFRGKMYVPTSRQ
ncbi:MAG: DUF721 domain-containing protein [Selenomonadales bacterium]|nr:DUF721 domain-containing protein [Selenomonadales bacterium]